MAVGNLRPTITVEISAWRQNQIACEFEVFPICFVALHPKYRGSLICHWQKGLPTQSVGPISISERLPTPEYGQRDIAMFLHWRMTQFGAVFSCRSKVDLRKRQTPETKQIVALPWVLSKTLTALPVKFCCQWDSQHFQGALFPWEIFVDSPHTGIKCDLPTAPGHCHDVSCCICHGGLMCV